MNETSAEWRRYGEAVIASMAEVLKESEEDQHAVLLETADYWLSLGLSIGLAQPDVGKQLLHLVEAHEPNRAELESDAKSFVQEALG